MQKKRYPGVRPFETADKELFFGRDNDVQDVSVLVALEKLVVLFGKSGYGKSSIINAGIIPHLPKTEDQEEEPIRPLIIRLGSYSGETSSQNPVDKVLAELKGSRKDKALVVFEQEDPKMGDSRFLEKLVVEQSLWYHFKRHQTVDPKRYLLIFDQFEEFFTYPLVQQESFKTQLAELLYTDLPQSVREAMSDLDKTQRRILSEALDVKVLIAIRSDRMSQLDSLKDKLPAILHKRFELKGLSESQAQEAIEKPAQREGAYDIAPFTYSPEALRLMLQKLGESKHQHSTGIEAFQLQILCEYLEGEITAGRIPQNQIEPSHFADKINAIYEGYYQRLLDKLSKNISKAAQRLIEDALIFSDEKTGEARRLSVDADVLVQRFSQTGITHETLCTLENSFLLRREANSMGGFSYEVSHDTLLEPIVKSRKEREAVENKRKAIKRRRRQFIFLLGALIVATASIFFGFWALQQREKATEAEKIANERLLQALQEKQERLNLEHEQLLRQKFAYTKANHTILLNENMAQIDKNEAQIKQNENEIKSITNINPK